MEFEETEVLTEVELQEKASIVLVIIKYVSLQCASNIVCFFKNPFIFIIQY